MCVVKFLYFQIHLSNPNGFCRLIKMMGLFPSWGLGLRGWGFGVWGLLKAVAFGADSHGDNLYHGKFAWHSATLWNGTQNPSRCAGTLTTQSFRPHAVLYDWFHKHQGANNQSAFLFSFYIFWEIFTPPGEEYLNSAHMQIHVTWQKEISLWWEETNDIARHKVPAKPPDIHSIVIARSPKSWCLWQKWDDFWDKMIYRPIFCRIMYKSKSRTSA